MSDPIDLVCMAKIYILKKEGIIGEISYERRACESVDDRGPLSLYLKNQRKTKLGH